MASQNENPGTGIDLSPTAGASSSAGAPPPGNPDRIDEIMAALNDPTLDNLPDHLRTFQYTEGFNPDKLEEELASHPFFMSEMPDPTKPLPPLLDAFQQLKYSEVENSNHELAINHKEDGLFHFKIKKYRIAASCFTNAISYAVKCEGEEPDKELIANLYNNRSACSWYIGNYRSCMKDCDEALKYKPGYTKVLKRAVQAAEKLKKWDEVERYCKLGQQALAGGDADNLGFYVEKRGNARRGKAVDEVRKRKMNAENVTKEGEKEALLEEIRKRGIKAKDWGFMESEAAQNGRVVRFNEEAPPEGGKKLCWPVLFMYPQFGDSDFVEAFEEDDSFSLQLYEILDANRPGWDVKEEYRLETAVIYYLGDKLVQVDKNSTLGDVLKQDWFSLPCNGVPSFFVLCENQFCKDFIERIDVM